MEQPHDTGLPVGTTESWPPLVPFQAVVFPEGYSCAVCEGHYGVTQGSLEAVAEDLGNLPPAHFDSEEY